jgi:phytoene dehydrogenase-like protein
MSTAVVVGSGPNGLAAAITLARAGVDVTVLEAMGTIGGGTRTEELTLPGLLHDVCSAVHPLGVGSPFMRSLGLEDHGVTWRYPSVELAHPLDGGRAGALLRSAEETATRLGEPAWARVFGALHFDDVAADVLQPVLHVPEHPVKLARFGAAGLLPAATYARRFRTEEARALFAGCASHAFRPLSAPLTTSFGLMLVASGHAFGWPVPEAGSTAISTAMASVLRGLGGRIETGVLVTDLPQADLVMLDVAPVAAVSILGDRLPPRVRRAYQRFRHGPAAFKVDLAVAGGVPWANEAPRRAGTVHVGGSLEEVAHAEREVSRGRLPQRPFVLVAQQYLADPTRSVGDTHPVWAYAHVPNGFTGDATEHVVRQIERFAPGFRERILASAVRGPERLAAYNPNYVGGDIATGAHTLRQVLFRPRVALDPYATGVPGVYLCSAATPPGGGVHGMCGHNAAKAALRKRGR